MKNDTVKRFESKCTLKRLRGLVKKEACQGEWWKNQNFRVNRERSKKEDEWARVRGPGTRDSGLKKIGERK